MTEFAHLDCSCCHVTHAQDHVYTNPNDGQYWCDRCYEASEWVACHDCEFWFHGSAMHRAPKTDSPAYTEICASCRNKRLTRARRFAG